MEQSLGRQTPGNIVRSAMEAKGWTQADLAYALGSTTAQVNYIMNDKRAISGAFAKALGVVLDRDPMTFMQAQAEWELQNAELPAPEIATRARVLTQYPLREMIKRGWVDPEHGNGTLEEQVCRFFEVPTLSDVPHLAHAARKTNYNEVPPGQLAWLFRVRQIASEMAVERYSRQKLEEALEKLSDLRTDADAVRYVPRLLREAGVRFVVVEGLPTSKIDGVCLWLDESSPVIGMSLRFDRIDNFWFVLRHECAHVLHKHGMDKAILDIDLDGDVRSDSPEEEIANREAADFCVPTEKMRSFYLRKNPYFAEKEVIAFAIRMRVHPGIVVGQLHRLIGRYDLLRRHLVRVRDNLSNAMMMDGWGDVVPTER